MSVLMINERLKSIEYLRSQYTLNMPTMYDFQVADFTIGRLEELKGLKEPSLNRTDFNIVMEKVSQNMKHYFSQDIYDAYLQKIKNRMAFINRHNRSGAYNTSFSYSLNPCTMDVPSWPDETSHIFIGHECIHVLKDGNNHKEWSDLLTYSEVLPFLYELIQVADAEDKVASQSIRLTLYGLLDRYHKTMTPKILANLSDKDNYMAYRSYDLYYYLSYYYAIILYTLYEKYPEDVTKHFESVLRHEITTRDMLTSFGLLDKRHDDEFAEGFSYTLKKGNISL